MGLISHNILVYRYYSITVLQYVQHRTNNLIFPIPPPKKKKLQLSMSSSSSSILLKNGTLLIHSADGVVNPTICDLLIRNNVIERIAQNIPAETGTVVIDCTDKIVSPGFIDTHRHMWHTQLKGHADSMLLKYIAEGRLFPQYVYIWDTD